MGPFLTQSVCDREDPGSKGKYFSWETPGAAKPAQEGTGKLSAQLHVEDKETGSTARAYLQHIKHQQVNQSTINPLDSDPSSGMLPDPSAGDQQQKGSSRAGTGHQQHKTRVPCSPCSAWGSGQAAHCTQATQKPCWKGILRNDGFATRGMRHKKFCVSTKPAALPSFLLPSPSQKCFMVRNVTCGQKNPPNNQQNKRDSTFSFSWN